MTTKPEIHADDWFGSHEAEVRRMAAQRFRSVDKLTPEWQQEFETAARASAVDSGLPVEIEAWLLTQSDEDWADRTREEMRTGDPEDVRLLVLSVEDDWVDLEDKYGPLPRKVRKLLQVVPDSDRLRRGYRQYRESGKRGLYRPTKKIIEQADAVLTKYWDDGNGYPLTIRQLYYKLVTQNVLRNSKAEYARLIGIMKDARYYGLISWDMLIDRTRSIFEDGTHADERAAIADLEQRFLLDKWADQPTRVEVWIEKDAAIGTIWTVCHELQVPLASTRGYNSTSGIKRAAERLMDRLKEQHVLILHIGDHDPSGVDMTRDMNERLDELVYADEALYGLDLKDHRLDRIALTMDQVHTVYPRGEDTKPIGQPVKESDSRTKEYIRKFGRKCWELDGLEPEYLVQLITDKVLEVRHEARWAASVEREAEARRNLGLARVSWDDAVRLGRLQEEAWQRN